MIMLQPREGGSYASAVRAWKHNTSLSTVYSIAPLTTAKCTQLLCDTIHVDHLLLLKGLIGLQGRFTRGGPAEVNGDGGAKPPEKYQDLKQLRHSKKLFDHLTRTLPKLTFGAARTVVVF